MSTCLLGFSHETSVLFATVWNVARQAPPLMEFPRQEYWSRLPCPPAGNLRNPGLKPTSLMSPALVDCFLTNSATWEAHIYEISIWGFKDKKQ